MARHRANRIKACELAAQVVGSIEGDVSAAKLMALTIFFESYIEHGSEWTSDNMKLMSRRKVKNLRVVAGGKL